MVFQALAQGGPTLLSIGASLFGGFSARKQGKRAERAAREAAELQRQGYLRAGETVKDYLGQAEELSRRGAELETAQLRKGLEAQTGYFDQSLGYLDPYIQTGLAADERLAAFGTAEGQEALGDLYRGSASANILQNVIDEQARRTAGEFSAQGLRGSGAYSEELTRRLADTQLQDYRNYLQNYLGTAQDLGTRGTTAGRTAAVLAGQFGPQTLRGYGQLGAAEARGERDAAAYREALGGYLGNVEAGIGGIQAGGVLGATAARNRGAQQFANFLGEAAGTASRADFSNLFGRRTPQPQLTGWEPYGTVG